MLLPKNILSGLREKPDFYLCDTGKEIMYTLHTYDENFTGKFNQYSELTFSVHRYITDMFTGEAIIDPAYDLVQGLRMVYIPGFGYFQIQSADVTSDGTDEYKSVTAYSSEYDLSQKYLENFIINMGTDGSVDGVQLYNVNDHSKSLLHLVFEKIPYWNIGHIDTELQTLQRSFEIDRSTIYDFIMNEMAETFKFYVEFDTVNNEINLYSEDEVGKDTDIYISLDTIASEVEISYSLDDIKTCLTVTGADDLDIRKVNLGLPYILNLSYYHTEEWMGKDLYDAYSEYSNRIQSCTLTYTQLLNNWNEKYDERETLSNLVPDYEKDDKDVNVVRQYSELPQANREKYGMIYKVNNENITNGTPIFYVCNSYTDAYGLERYRWDIATNNCGIRLLEEKEACFMNIQQIQAGEGWSEQTNPNHSAYSENLAQLNQIRTLLQQKRNQYNALTQEIESINTQMVAISNSISMSSNFTPSQMAKLSAFIREDEYKDDNFVVTDIDTDSSIVELQQALKETAGKELAKISQPQLEFSMKMANIFAIPEFEPIIKDFKFGNRINVIIREDYCASVRILEIKFSFSNLDDFSVTFGNLSSLRSAVDIHAELLKQATNAGKSVASNSSYWQKGADKATATDIKIRNGLIDATTSIKSDSAGQAVEWDNYGIHLRKYKDGSTEEYDPEQIWMVNNKILFSDDNFESSRSLLGKFSTDGGQTYNYGLIAEAVIGGYIEGTNMVGGTIKIGLQEDGTYAFEVHEDGTVTMNGGSDGGSSGDMSGYVTKKDFDNAIHQINSNKMYRVEVVCSGPQIMNVKNQTATLACKVYSWDTDITDTLDASLFNWVRNSNDPSQDLIWNENTIHKGIKTLTISTEDIYNNASFNCEVSLPD